MAVYSISYPATGTITLTASGLTGDTNASGIATGRVGTFIDNSANLYVDYILSGSFGITTGSATNRQAEIWIAPANNPTATTFAGSVAATDSGSTFTRTDTKTLLKLGLIIALSTATNEVYNWVIPSVAKVCDGVCPQKFNIWFGQSHNAPVATGPVFQYQGVQYTSA